MARRMPLSGIRAVHDLRAVHDPKGWNIGITQLLGETFKLSTIAKATHTLYPYELTGVYVPGSYVFTLDVLCFGHLFLALRLHEPPFPRGVRGNRPHYNERPATTQQESKGQPPGRGQR